MSNFEEKLAVAEDVLQENTYGHLPLSYRVAIMVELGDKNLVNKIFLECAKKVYTYWQQKFPADESVYLLIQKSESYLYQNKLIALDKEADKLRNYFDTITEQQASSSAHSALSLCYSIAYNASGILAIDDYDNEDDDAFDWETWNPDFWAAMAYANGNPFLNKGSIERRREFWKWYLGTIASIRNDNFVQLQIFNEQKATSEPASKIVRTQSYQDPVILAKLEQIVAFAQKDRVKQYPDSEWSQLQIECYCMSAGTSLQASFTEKNSNEKRSLKLSYYLYLGEQSSAFLINQVKKLMYNQAPAEGAWFKCAIIVNELNQLEVYFDYDNKESIPEGKANPDYLQMEFTDFPRSIHFTPSWWQNLIDNKVSYIV